MVVTDVARLYESARARVIEDDLERAGDPISEAEIEEQIGSREDLNRAGFPGGSKS